MRIEYPENSHRKMKKGWVVFVPLLMIVLILLLYCNSGSGKQRIFLITLDTMRADHVDYSRKGNDKTPNLASLASGGTSFRNAFTLIPITLPSHSNMFYSLPPHKLGILNNGEVVDVPEKSLIEILKDDGFSTHGVISLGVLKSDFGIHRGFEQFSEEFAEGLFYKEAGEVNNEVFRILERKSRDKEFFWVHYSDPHSPYFPPGLTGGEFRVKFNKKHVYSCRSTDYRKIDLNLLLAPGTNYLNFKTTVPKMIKGNKNVRIFATSLIDFTAVARKEGDRFEVVFPEDWNRHSEKNSHFASTARRMSGIRLTNKMKTPIQVNVSFVYRMLTTIPSSKYLYGESVKYMDMRIGELLDHLKRKKMYRDSVFIVLGDHGEGLGEYRQEVGHVNFLNGVFTRIPFIISGKKIPEGRDRSDPVTTLEVAPTILELAGIEKPEYMSGYSVFNRKSGRMIYQETYSPEAEKDGYSIIDYPYQLIFYPDRNEDKFEFYRMDSDPNGLVSLIDNEKYSGMVGNYKKKIFDFIKQLKIPENRDKKRDLNKDQKDMLKTLGYL